MERFIRGEISVRCDTQKEVEEFLQELASKYPTVRWRDSGELVNHTPRYDMRNRYIVFYCAHNILTLGSYTMVTQNDKADGYVVRWTDLQCGTCESIAQDDLASILSFD